MSEARARNWPDMSAYGIHFGVLDMPNGDSKLVMVDKNGSWGELAKRMGFQQSRWFGLWVKSSLRLDIPGFGTRFPSARVIKLTDQEIRDQLTPLILERRHMRLSQMHRKGRLSWHPEKTVVGQAAEAVVEDGASGDEAETRLSASSALRQTIFLGLNSLGQEVFEAGDGARFTKAENIVIGTEDAERSPNPLFLRAGNDQDLVQIAAGMVAEIDRGGRLNSDDFIRFIEAALGDGSSDDQEKVNSFQVAVDRAIAARLRKEEAPSPDAFTTALRLHEGRPSFWRKEGDHLPAPVGLIIQRLASALSMRDMAGVEPSVVVLGGDAETMSWGTPGAVINPEAIVHHDVTIGSLSSNKIDAVQVGAYRADAEDTLAILRSLEKRSAKGSSIFVVDADVPGVSEMRFRRTLSTIGQAYDVTSVVDLDPGLLGVAKQTGKRIIIIGDKKDSPDFTFSVPAQLPVVFDYETLWSWSEAVSASATGLSETFGDDGREENRWQAPYIPASQVSEPKSMAPRNLLGPVRKSLARLVEMHGMGIDDFVSSKLGWNFDELSRRLDSEQVDAVALGIQAVDDGVGVVEADATGLGKGRVAAALALYAKKCGIKTVFMTEKTDLFSDIYRDIKDIEAFDEFQEPFIVNSDLIVRDSETLAPMLRSGSREQAQVTFACGEAPKESLVLATYSQFNRAYDPQDAAPAVKLSRAIRSVLNGEMSAFDALSCLPESAGLPDYKALGLSDLSGAATHEERLAADMVSKSLKEIAVKHEERAKALRAGTDGVLALLGSYAKNDLITLKHQWLYSGALDGCLLILDESHIAAGDQSQTGVNLQFLASRAHGVEYSSATYAKDIKNFDLYKRVFPASVDTTTIASTLARGGETMQEIISAMLAQDGRLIRREHDLSGIVFKLSMGESYRERNVVWANGLADVISAMSLLSGKVSGIAKNISKELLEKMESARDAILAAQGVSTAKVGPRGGKIKPPKVANLRMETLQYTSVSSRLYNISRAFMMAVNADQAADDAIRALREGRKPVITVENTMEAVLAELVNGVRYDAEVDTDGNVAQVGDDLFGAVEPGRVTADKAVRLNRSVGFKDILLAYVDSMFSANEQVYEGKKMLSTKRISLANPELELAADELRETIRRMPDIPLSPIDMVRARIVDAGFSVDEISGRKTYLRVEPDGTHSVARLPTRRKQSIKKAFNDGKLDAVILSKSGSTGISLHASRTFADQSQRELIELQVAADIAQRLQFWGRVNRKGQVCNPVIRMIASGLPAETRLIMMQNSKLRRMSANTSGNADNSALNDEVPDILNKIGNEVCYRWMENNPKLASILGFDIAEAKEETSSFSNTKFVDMLSSRLCMLHVDQQERALSEITSEFEALIEELEMSGTNPLKSLEFDVKAKVRKTACVQVPTGSKSVFDEAVEAAEIEYKVQLPAVDREPILKAIEEGRADLVGQFGADVAGRLTEILDLALQEHLPAILPSRYKSIEEALLEELKNNPIKNAHWKVQRCTEILPFLVPGSLIRVVHEERSEEEASAGHDPYSSELLVTGWKLPKSNMLSQADFKIVAFNSELRKTVSYSLSSLLKQQGIYAIGTPFEAELKLSTANKSYYQYDSDTHETISAKTYDKKIDLFFSTVAKASESMESRIILRGNLFRAAQLADAARVGGTIAYTDERGVWNHAILLPRSFSLDWAANLPVPVTDADMLTSAFASVGSIDDKTGGKTRINKDVFLKVTDDLRTSVDTKGSYALYGRLDRVYVAVPQSSPIFDLMIKDKNLLAHLENSALHGDRNMRTGNVIPGAERAFCEAFVELCKKSSTPMLMSGRETRAWYNDYLTRINGLEMNQAAIDKALAVDELDEVDALLTAAP